MRRNPGLTDRIPQHLAKARADVTLGEIDDWFKEAEPVLKIEAPGALEDADRMWNCDEVGLPLNQKSQ